MSQCHSVTLSVSQDLLPSLRPDRDRNGTEAVAAIAFARSLAPA